ncbi:MAG TPA: glycosyltransferase family 2 protein [Chlamydiales bacterium]|nr:glycosyltransferase family 2 protein [Chlamydiales bacterium]
MDKRKIQSSSFKILIICGIFAALIYLILRTILYFGGDHPIKEMILGLILLFCEIFVVIQGIGYLMELFSVSKIKNVQIPEEVRKSVLENPPAVTILIPSYKEPIEVIETTILACYNMNYPNKQIVLLDDTRYDLFENSNEAEEYKKNLQTICIRDKINLFRRKWRGAKAGIINDYLAHMRGESPPEMEFERYDEKGSSLQTKYIAIFDADQNPMPDFLDELVVKMEADPQIAFIQTPQYYTNFLNNKVAYTASMQQIIFFEYICEGKGAKESMFCCGTNVLFKTEALNDIKGFEEDSVTEDAATSVNLHEKGWKTAYDNKVSAFGDGPETLESYFNQQYRWALGNLGLFLTLIRKFFKNPKALSPAKWWEYALSTSHYLIGFVFIVFLLLPVIYLTFKIPGYFASVYIYALIFIPYFAIILGTFIWTLKKRNYPAKGLFLAQWLMMASFPVYIKATFNAFLGKKGKFITTPKGKNINKNFSFKMLWPQILFSGVAIWGLVWGISRIYFEQRTVGSYIANAFWCLYYALIILILFYFIDPKLSYKTPNFPPNDDQKKTDSTLQKEE